MEAGDVLFVSDDSEEFDDELAYTKYKELTIIWPGEYRIKFDIKSQNTSNTTYGRIYKNGSPVGTEQTCDIDTYTTESEDISSWAEGDLCKMYLKSDSVVTDYYVKNFRVYGNFFAYLVR